MLFSGRAYPELAKEVGEHLGIEPTPTELRDFANGEIYVRFEESVRGCDAFVIESHCAPINQWVMEQLIMVDAPKQPGVVGARVEGRRPQARAGKAHPRRRAFLSVRATGKQAPGARADLGA